MRNRILVQKMCAYIIKVLDYCDGCSYDDFTSDMKPVEACVFNLSQLGELCHLADHSFTELHPEIPWHQIYGLRNRIVHDYEGVNLRLVWEIISTDLSALLEVLQKLLDDDLSCTEF